MGLIMSILDAAGRAIAKPNADEAEVDVLNDGESSSDVLVNWSEGGKKKSATGKIANSTLAQMTLQTVSIPQNFAGLESVSTPTRLRYQIFTITSVDEQDDYVEVVASHIFYEQATNYTVWTPETLVNYSCGAICRNVMNNTINGDEGFRVATDCTDQLPWHQIDYARKNLVEVFLDPERGICNRFNLNIVRDNMNFYVLKNVGYDRGFVIEDKKNLLGVQRQESIDNTVTRIAAYGKDKNGNILWLNNNGKRYVDSQYIANYKRPRVEIYDTGIQITGDKEEEQLHDQGRDNEIVTAENINDRIYQAAVKRFTEDHVDDPEVTMKVDFISLGDTEEYKQYRDLDKVYLYDIVHVKHSGRDYSYGAQVIGVEHDILTGMLMSVTIGNIVSWDGIRKVANWQVPEIDGSIIRMHSITSSQYQYGSVTGSAIRDEAIEGNHLNKQSVSQALNIDQLKSILAQAGLVLNDQGILIYQNTDDNMLGTRLEVQGRRIGMVIGSNASGDFIKAGEIALAFNNADEAVAHINADHVNISATSTLHSLAGAIEEDDQGNVTIKSAGGMRVRKTVSGQVAEFGVFDENSLTAGVIVDRVNGGSVYLKGSKVWVGDAATDQTLKKWATESDGLFAQNIGALSARIGTIEADYITANEIDGDFITARVGTANSMTIGTLRAVNLYCGTTSTALSGSTVVQSVVGAPVTGGGYKFTVTMLNGTSQDYSFNVASSITLSGAWTGASYTATAKDPDDNVLGTVTTAISKRWVGSSLVIESGTDSLLSEPLGYLIVDYTPSDVTGTVSSFSNTHTAGVFVTAQSAGGGNGRIYTFKVDATSVYNAVTLTPSWNPVNGTFTVIPSNTASPVSSTFGIAVDASSHRLSLDKDGSTAQFWFITATPSLTYNSSTHTYTPKVTVNAGQTALYTDYEGTASGTEAYQDGWGDAYGDIAFPSAGTGESFSVTIPSSTVGGTPVARTFTMAKGTPGASGYASVAYNGSAVARIDISNWYTTGRTDGAASVTLSSSGWSNGSLIVTASNGETETISIPAIASTQWVNTSGRTWRTDVTIGGVVRSSTTRNFDSYYTDGQDSVTLSAGTWSSGSLTVTASNGATETVSIPAVSSTSWVNTSGRNWRADVTIGGVIRSSTTRNFDSYYTDGQASVTLSAGTWSSGSLTVTASNSKTVAVTIPAISATNWVNTTGRTWRADVTIGGVTRSSTTRNFDSYYTDGYSAGYSAGWAAARAKIGRSGAKIVGPPATVDGAAVEWYNITVVQGSIGATRVTSSQYTLTASASAYINGTAVATSSTSRGLTV